MDDQDGVPPPPAQPGLFAAALNNANVQTFVERHRTFLALRQQRLADEEQLEVADINYETILTLLQTAVNGEYDLPQQQIEVEYLRLDQRLCIPAGIGMSTRAEIAGPVAVNQTFLDRYRKMLNAQYRTLRNFVDTRSPAAAIVAYVDALLPAAIPENDHVWDTRIAVAVEDDSLYVSLVYGVVSQALQMNFDVRDYGALLRPDMRLADGAWMDIATVPKTRLHNKLHAWTLTCLATLNLPQCRNSAIAAWVRAYGVGSGFLPTNDSGSRKEYMFTLRMGRADARKVITDYEAEYREPLHQLSINVISMFGLFHLAKDHTYRTNDANMERIGTAYINALRTNVPSATITEMINDRETIVRTAAHPFGLGQTYFVAKLAARHFVIAEPLRIRQNVTPPPVQRLMVVYAAHTEWSSLPAGAALNQSLGAFLDKVIMEIEEVNKIPPAYSSLYRLYGLDSKRDVSEEARAAANIIMPSVYGFAEAVHVDDANRKDGIALALSLVNIARDQKVLAQSWATVWRSYLETMDKEGIIAFARSAIQAAMPVPPPAN